MLDSKQYTNFLEFFKFLLPPKNHKFDSVSTLYKPS